MGLINPSEGASLERSGEFGSLFGHRVGAPWRVSLNILQLTFHATSLLPGYGLPWRQDAQKFLHQKHHKVNYIKLHSVMERLQTSGINLFGLEFSSMLIGQESLGKLFKYFEVSLSSWMGFVRLNQTTCENMEHSALIMVLAPLLWAFPCVSIFPWHDILFWSIKWWVF